MFSDKFQALDDKVEDSFSEEEIEVLDKTIDFFKDYRSRQLMNLFRSSIKNESDIKTLFLRLTGNFKNPL